MPSQTQSSGAEDWNPVPCVEAPLDKNTAVGKTLNIDAVRGLACLLVVALHVVGDSDSNGLHLPMTSYWHYVMTSVEFLRMPLFTALSGYLYANHRVTRTEFSGFWTKKLRRLAVPLVFATVVFWSLRHYAHNEQTSLTEALLFRYGHLWYLQALLILFAAISISDAFFQISSVSLVLVGLSAIMISAEGLPISTFFGLTGAFYLAPYFLFGIILRERPQWLQDPRSGVLAAGIIIIVLTSQQLGLFGLAMEITSLQLPAAVAGMAGVVFLLQRFPNSVLLAGIGRYSYTIYLWHILASAAVRDGLIKVGVTAIPTLFILGLIAAIAAPMALYHLARRIPLLSVAFTGERWIPVTKKPSIIRQGSVLVQPPLPS